jgi:GTP-binding protein
MRYTFVDEVTIHVRSGDGGAGCVAFRREKFIPYGGPNGGDGGRGGDVTLAVDPQLATLLDYRFRPKQHAGHGQGGMGNQCTGRDGRDLTLRVPQGTVIYNAETGELLADLSAPDSRYVAACGGRGGKGNEHFKSSTRQAPRFAQPGEPGVALDIRLELKLLADVGLVGLPNVGTSSLIARISASKPKIADYPFTTLVPNLGVVRFGDMQHYVVADVPGLIVGAHKGAGLGSRFLRHVERVHRIVHLVTADPDQPERDPVADFLAIEEEMRLHDARLAEVPRVLVLNRCDLPDVAAHADRVAAFAKERGVPFFAISAASGAGITDLVNCLGEAIVREREALAAAGPTDRGEPAAKQGVPDDAISQLAL